MSLGLGTCGKNGKETHRRVRFQQPREDMELNGAANAWPQKIWKVVGGGTEGVPVSKDGPRDASRGHWKWVALAMFVSNNPEKVLPSKNVGERNHADSQ